MRQDVQACGLRSPVEGLEPNADVLRRILGILDEDIEIAVLIEYPSVQQLILALSLSAPVFFHQLTVRILALRILIEHPHVTMGRNIIEIEPILLNVLAAISF